MKCPSCGTSDQSGKFCAQCGAALGGACASCGAELPSGSRFCTNCGQPAAAAAGRRGLPWPWIAGIGAVVLVVLVFMLPRSADRAGPPAMTNPAAAPGGSGAISGDGLLSDDMRSNADRLFNRIMTAAEQGNQAEVAQFMPMAIQAYGMVEGQVEQPVGDNDAAIATAERILEESGEHVLALGAAATGAERAGDAERARDYHRRLLEAYPTEAAKPLPEYVDHQRMLPEYRRAAREALGQDG